MLWTSSDSGSTWLQQNSTSATNLASSLNYLVSTGDGNKLIATTSSYIYTSVDAGVTWTTRQQGGWSTADLGYYFGTAAACSRDGNTCLAAEVSWAGTVWLSTNAGASWTSQSTKLGNTGYVAVASSADGVTIMAGGYHDNGLGGLMISTNSGATWAAVAAASGLPSNHWASLAMSSDGTKLFAANSDSTFVSNDSGAS